MQPCSLPGKQRATASPTPLRQLWLRAYTAVAPSSLLAGGRRASASGSICERRRRAGASRTALAGAGEKVLVTAAVAGAALVVARRPSLPPSSAGRAVLASLAAMLVLLHPGALNAEEEGGPATSFVSRSSPTAERLAVGLSPSGSLLPCSSSFNCVSTASRAAEAYVGPWQTDGQATAAEATAALRDAALALFPGAAVAEEGARPPHGAYLRLRVPGRFPGPPDEMEFLVRDHGVGDRGWAGDDASRGSLLVTMRSSAARSVFVYPFTVSVSDGGLQAQRLRELRARLGWRLVGCELAECYGQ